MAQTTDTAGERGREVTNQLALKGVELGFAVSREYPVQGGRLDLVWSTQLDVLSGVEDSVPVVGIEIESSWRTRKHLKGDYLNLFDLGAALGVIVLLGDGEDVEATRRFARTLVNRAGPRILVWGDREIDVLINGSQTDTPLTDSSPIPRGAITSTASNPTRHVGKYRALWEWLQLQPGDPIAMTFAEIEEVIGQPLPPSSRRHPSHWSGYEGSAVVRAIHDAGWRASHVNLGDETLLLTRSRSSRR